MQIVSAYQELGSYRAAAKACGTTPKTVRRVIERQVEDGKFVVGRSHGQFERLARIRGKVSIVAQRGEHAGVIRHVGHHGHVRVILGRRVHQHEPDITFNEAARQLPQQPRRDAASSE